MVGAIEKHLQTSIQIILVLIVGWFGMKTTSTSDTVIRLETQILFMSKEILGLKKDLINATADRYTGEDAASDRRFVDIQIKALQARMTSLERTKK